MTIDQVARRHLAMNSKELGRPNFALMEDQVAQQSIVSGKGEAARCRVYRLLLGS